MHQKIANATFKVICNDSIGSGFSFINRTIVITNMHVIANLIDFKDWSVSSNPVKLQTENGEEFSSIVVGVDPENDTAILKLTSSLPESREILMPFDGDFKPTRGRRVIFTGYPHGLDVLLAHEGIISAPLECGQFNIDGMVNGGNSGGPIVSVDSGKVIGIITARRFVGKDEINELRSATSMIIEQCEYIRRAGTIISSGFNVADLNQAYATGLSVLTSLLESNANSGIAIGYPVAPITKLINEMVINKII